MSGACRTTDGRSRRQPEPPASSRLARTRQPRRGRWCWCPVRTRTVPSTGTSPRRCARWPTVVLDVPGQPGLSADIRPRRGRSAWYGQWLTEALEQTVPGKALVVGHSLGGAIVLASASPRIAGRIVLSSAGLVRLLLPPAVMVRTVPWLTRPTVPRTARMLRPMVAPGGRVPDELAEWMCLVARCCHSSLAPPPLPPALLAERRTVPCLVATGRYDVFLPPRRMGPAAQRHLGTRLHVLDGSGHLLLDEAPDEIVALVERALAASSGDGA
ncbi:alpha/beta fold hydrolase [Streptomyces prunicolor]|uniref:alpha/beta fold hydrolase n=1 Tax=Streptomyces prunicolor TaxID=67348 RepID=UPI001FDEABC5|nr:alpha/beta hydrolase [Streptomyces prunicolor]